MSLLSAPGDMYMISTKVLAHQPLAVLAEDCNGIVKIANSAFCKMFDITFPPETLMGMDCNRLKEESRKLLKDDSGFIDRIAAILREQQPVSDLEFELKDGRCLSVDYTPCFEENTLLGHIWCYTDISIRVNATRKMSDQKRFFENVLNSIPAEITVLDTDNKCLFANSAVFEDPAVRTAMTGKNDLDYNRMKNKEHLQAIRFKKFNEVISNGKESEWEDMTQNSLGEKSYMLRRLSPNRDEKGRLISITGYGVNITQLKKKEEELIVSEYKLRKLLDQLHEVFFRLTYEMTIEFLNPAWSEILGFDTNDCIGHRLSDFVVSADKQLFSVGVDDILSRKKQSLNQVFRFRAKDGRARWLRVFMAPTEKLIHLAIWGTLTDVTEQQLAEQEMLKTLQREKELNELKSSFVQMVSHEFRTPLAGILSSVELLELMESQANPTFQHNPVYYYELIKGQVSRMTELMNNVLLLGRIESGKVELNPSDVTLSSLCREIIRHCFHHTQRIIQADTQGCEHVTRVDTALIKHIITNLLSNALKYSPKEKKVQLLLKYDPHSVSIHVSDEGIGIPKKEQDQLFNSFFRASNTSGIEGTGLGLVVVKYFVELHEGTVSVKSSPGKGSVFVVTLPM